MTRTDKGLLRRFPEDVAEYLSDLLSCEQTAAIKEAFSSNKVIIIKGVAGMTGKSTLKAVLNNCGLKAVEEFETVEITLNKALKNPVIDLRARFFKKGAK